MNLSKIALGGVTFLVFSLLLVFDLVSFPLKFKKFERTVSEKNSPTRTKISKFDCVEKDTWVKLPNVPGSIGETVSIVYNNSLYVAGEGDTRTFKYDLILNKWSNVSNRIYLGNHENGVLYNDSWWLIGGIGAHNYGKVQVYHFKQDKWIEKQSLQWDGGSVCVSKISNRIYACGGIFGFKNGRKKMGTNTTNLCAFYDMLEDNKWENNMSNMIYGRNHAACGSDGKYMYVFGGRIGKNRPSNGFSNIQRYDPLHNQWIILNTSLPIGRGGTGNSAFDNINNEFYIIGGETKSDIEHSSDNFVYNLVNIYNIKSNKWRIGSKMITPRHGMYPVYWRNNNNGESAIYISGGGIHRGYSTSNTFDKYCISIKH